MGCCRKYHFYGISLALDRNPTDAIFQLKHFDVYRFSQWRFTVAEKLFRGGHILPNRYSVRLFIRDTV
jgi:hypothetical protein